ncbi:MAG: peptidylprolyl isomerase, partial [Pararhodobacter sp.]|nr:peptidylprolyl isomerase [Pararhodobacter sp.]
EWLRDPSRFRSPPLWEVSHILVACDPRDETARAKAQDRATALLVQLRATPRDFARLAADNSDCGSKSSGGALGQLNPGDTVPEFEAALRDMAEGELSRAPILTRYGYHLIRMDAVAEGAVLPFEAVRPKISEAIEKATWAREAKVFVDALVGSAEISGVDLTSG